MEPLTLDVVDRDGAIRETMDATVGDSRASFLRRGVMLGGGLVGGGALLAMTAGAAQAQTPRDIRILNFALTLEYLEAAFYAEAIKMGALEGRALRFARVAGAHERTHVRALRAALGRRAVPRPRFNFRGTTEDPERFRETAIVLEDTGVRAYAGQAPRIRSDAILLAALKIHSVEARHAAWIRHIAGQPPAPEAFAEALSMREVLQAVKGTRFIVAARRRTRGDTAPRFTG